ncbi:acyl-CoA carboxylase subunit beta [Salinispora cortesiana]|uniref:acyl-CoA carboxylase subunit beta n=1 Tax=Salinispora cortesiana TaxID=1305843 RepID=UPI000407A14F|nr:acyl-CoA carboxylase subunit beta [Salinispora cortesiana]
MTISTTARTEQPMASPAALSVPGETGGPARRRLDLLADRGSLVELGSGARHRVSAFNMQSRRPAGDGVVTALARVDQRPVALFAQDSTVLGGSLGETHAAKIVRIMEWAGRSRMPVVGLVDSGGARIQEGVGALDGYGAIFRANVRHSGRVPQISVILGPCAGGAAYSPALTDIVIMRRDNAHMFLTGPAVVKAVTREDVSAAELGGSAVHSRRSGTVHLVADDDVEALSMVAQVLSYLPSSCWDDLPLAVPALPQDMPEIPSNHRVAYDVRRVVRGIVDRDSFLELQSAFARNLVTGFARLNGCPVGVVANQPSVLAGTLDLRSSEKGARFVRLCDAFGLPLITFVDTPGFLPGTAQEEGGAIRRGAKLLYAFAEATVPRLTVVLRKAFGGAYIVMNSRSLGADAVLAWPGAELAVMGAEGAVDIIHRRDLAQEPHRRDELIDGYRAQAMSAELSAERMSVDEIVRPEQTRSLLVGALDALRGARRPTFRHDNLPQ